MGRLGLPTDQWRPVLEDLVENPWIRLEGIASHFSSAESDPDYTEMQLDRFEEAVKQLRSFCKTAPRQLHVANSAGILNHPKSFYSMVRPGLLLYGVYPEPGLREKISVRPAMTFKTNVLYVKSLPPGRAVSYGQTFRTKRTSRIATLAVGYADGYRRDLSNRGWVLVRGHKAPVVGNVTMDLTMIDVTDAPDVAEGDEVILFGAIEGACLPVEDLAAEADTIPYELLCGVSRRVPRVYCRGGKILDVP
jgi:alanine racemase